MRLPVAADLTRRPSMKSTRVKPTAAPQGAHRRGPRHASRRRARSRGRRGSPTERAGRQKVQEPQRHQSHRVGGGIAVQLRAYHPRTKTRVRPSGRPSAARNSGKGDPAEDVADELARTTTTVSRSVRRAEGGVEADVGEDRQGDGPAPARASPGRDDQELSRLTSIAARPRRSPPREAERLTSAAIVAPVIARPETTVRGRRHRPASAHLEVGDRHAVDLMAGLNRPDRTRPPDNNP